MPILVKFVGHIDQITADWNGRRYVFNKSKPVTEIPEELFNFIKSSNFIYKDDIVIHHQEPVDTVKAPPDLKPIAKKYNLSSKKRRSRK